ncbi:MAG: phage tail protein [Polyangiaceae bacterium]
MDLASVALSRVDAEVLAPGPALINRDPAPGEADVPLGTPIALEITTASTDALEAWSVRVTVNDAPAYDGSAATPIAVTYAGPASLERTSGPTLRVVLDSAAPLPSGADVRVRVVASSSGGASRLDATYTFTMEDVAPPRLVAAFALDAHTVRLAFDKAVAQAPASAFALTPLGAPAASGTITAVSGSAGLVDLTLASPLSPAVDYEVSAIGVADARGHTMPAPGDTARFTAFAPPRPPGRKFDLWSMLPKHNRRLDTTGELASFVACLQEVTDWLLAELDALADLPDIERAPEWMLDRILADLGNPFTFPLTALDKRRLASMLVSIYQQKGTAPGIKNAVRFFLGLDDLQITPLTATTLVLGESELGVDWELGPRARFARYAFEVVVSRILTDDETAALSAIVRYAKPAHTHLTAIRMPEPPPAVDHWEIGMSELGTQSILH